MGLSWTWYRNWTVNYWAMIRSGQCEKLLQDNRDRDHAMCDLSGLVKKNLDRPSEHLTQPDAYKPHPIIRPDLIDGDGNLRATDIGITWEGSETFLHGVRVVRSDVAGQPTRPRPATSAPYQPVRDHAGCNISTPRQPTTIPTCLENPDTCAPPRRIGQESQRHQYSGSTLSRWTGRPGFDISGRLRMFMVGIKVKGPYS